MFFPYKFTLGRVKPPTPPNEVCLLNIHCSSDGPRKTVGLEVKQAASELSLDVSSFYSKC